MTSRSTLNFLMGLGIFCTTLFGWNIQVGASNLNPERILYFVIVLMLLPRLTRIMRRRALWKYLKYYISWLVVTFISLLLSKNPIAHIPGLAIYTIPVAFFILFSSGSNNVAVVDRWVYWSLIFCLGFSALVLSGVVDRSPFFAGSRMMLLMSEPNILGAVAGAFIILMIPSMSKSVPRRLVVLFSVFLVFMSFSKAPYGAFALCLTLYFYLSAKRKSQTTLLTVTIVSIGVFLAIILLAFSDDLLGIYNQGLAREDAVNTRFLIIGFAWERFLEHPILGNGPLDFAIYAPDFMYKLGSDSIRSVWIPQVFVAVLHDTGVIGFFVFVLFIFKLLTNFSTANTTAEQARRGSSYFCAFLMLFICSQATTTHLSAIFGIVSGLLASYIVESQEKRYTSDSHVLT